MLIEHATTIEARTAARIELARRADADAAPGEGAAFEAGARSTLSVRITDDSTGELEWEGPLAVFLADNADALEGSGLADVDTDDLVVGATIYMGGGASPLFKVTVVAAGGAR